jgi:hypothetical protein
MPITDIQPVLPEGSREPSVPGDAAARGQFRLSIAHEGFGLLPTQAVEHRLQLCNATTGHSVLDVALCDTFLRASAILTACSAYPRLVAALRNAEAQVVYLHGKFAPTGSGEQVLAQIRAILRELGEI